MATRGEAISHCIKDALATFKKTFGPDAVPSIAAYAPGRVNLIGEHTDYNMGCVFPMALQHVTVIIGRPIAGNNCRVITTASLTETNDITFPIPAPPTQEEYNSTTRITLQTPDWAHYVVGVVALMSCNIAGQVNLPAFEAVIASCVPLGGGVSSSAALEVATCFFIEELCRHSNVPLPPRTNAERALLCQKAEHMYAHSPCGIMDQFVSVMAKENKALYIDCQPQNDGTFQAEDIPLALDGQDLVVMVANTNVKHNVGAGEYEKRRDRCYAACKKLGVNSLRDVNSLDIIENISGSLSDPVPDGPTEYQCAIHVVSEINRTIEAKEVLKSHDFRRFGELMNDSHESLKSIYKVSCYELDLLVELARRDKRVYGSRMTGAGFGGCTVTLLEKGAVNDVQQKIKEGYCNAKGERLEATFFTASPCAGAGVIADINNI